jgi:limonene-1,2-epoxide hydrolase
MTFDRAQAEREVLSVLDAFLAAFNRQDARAEARTYHFPHFRLANDQMSAWDGPSADTDAWMNSTYRMLRESGWDHSSWTRRRIVHISDSKAHVDIEFTRHRKDGAVMATIESLYIVTKEGGHWGIKLRSSFDRVVAAPGDKRNPQ